MQQSMQDHPLRIVRQKRNLSLQEVADATTLGWKTIWRAERGYELRPESRRLLCEFFEMSAEELGLLRLSESQDENPSIEETEHQDVGSQEEETAKLGDHIMANLDRRTFLGAALAGGSLLLPKGILHTLAEIDGLGSGEHTLQQFESLNNVCWGLSNSNQLDLVEQLLHAYLPRVTAIAHQSEQHRTHAASLVSRGYILAAEVDKQNVAAMQSYAQQATFYSQFSNDHNVQCDALRQEATIALVAKQPFKALLAYQKALMLVDRVTPLLRSRIYLGLASALARCNPVLYKQEALKYLGMACEHFPAEPEKDPWYLYMYASGNKAVLHLYEALTYNDLNQPHEAWNALMEVDGLHPKLPVTESARIEFINLQAKTAADLGNMHESCSYIETSVQAADASGYTVWREEAADIHQELLKLWPHELQVRRLGKLFKKGA
jgi:transcriptional regulator with XRE-family HTH domain